MTVKEILLKELGRKGYGKLSSRFKAIVKQVDSLPPLPLRPAPRSVRRAAA